MMKIGYLLAKLLANFVWVSTFSDHPELSFGDVTDKFYVGIRFFRLSAVSLSGYALWACSGMGSKVVSSVRATIIY